MTVLLQPITLVFMLLELLMRPFEAPYQAIMMPIYKPLSPILIGKPSKVIVASIILAVVIGVIVALVH